MVCFMGFLATVDKVSEIETAKKVLTQQPIFK